MAVISFSQRLSPVELSDAHLPMRHMQRTFLPFPVVEPFKFLRLQSVTCAPKRSTNVPTQRWAYCFRFRVNALKHRRNVSAQEDAVEQAKNSSTRLACLSHRSQCLPTLGTPTMTAKILIIKMSIGAGALPLVGL